MNKLAYDLGQLAANSAIGAGLGGWAGATMAPEEDKLRGALEGALAGGGIGALKSHILKELLTKHYDKISPLAEMLPLATLAGGLKGSQVKHKHWWE